MASALTWVFHPCSHLLKLHTTAHTVPSLQLPLSWEEQRRKLQRENRPGEHLLSSVMGHGSHPRSQRELKSQRLLLRCLSIKIQLWKLKKGKGTQGQGSDARHDGPGCMGKGTQGSQRTDTHLHSRRVSWENECKVCCKSLSVCVRKQKRPDSSTEMTLFPCICLTQFYLVAFCTISCSSCC